jgi:hypothetical protein
VFQREEIPNHGERPVVRSQNICRRETYATNSKKIHIKQQVIFTVEYSLMFHRREMSEEAF